SGGDRKPMDDGSVVAVQAAMVTLESCRSSGGTPWLVAMRSKWVRAIDTTLLIIATSWSDDWLIETRGQFLKRMLGGSGSIGMFPHALRRICPSQFSK